MRQARKNKTILLTILLTGFILVFLLLLFQTIGGIYANRVYIPWMWFLLLYIPPLTYGMMFRDDTGSMSLRASHLLALLFVVATLATILLQRLAVEAEDGQTISRAFSNHLLLSLLFLLPLEAFLIFSLWRAKKNAQPPVLEPRAFISYNHGDSPTALKIKASLKQAGIPVILDQTDMEAGQDIHEFIQASIKRATAIVLLVSDRSLKSAWVGKESMDSLFLRNYLEDKKVIACYLEDHFFRDDYTLEAISEIDLGIRNVQEQIEKSHDAGIDTRDLNDKKSRLMGLRAGLDGIIGSLRGSLCLDVRGDHFEKSMERLVAAVKSRA